jgi:hypothetical protein
VGRLMINVRRQKKENEGQKEAGKEKDLGF